MQQYCEYKDSGIEWIGKIPAGWEVRRFRTLFLFSHGVHITKTDFTEQGILCATYGDVHAKGNTELNPDTQSLHYIDIKFTETSKNAKLRKNDFVFADTSEDIEGSGNFTYLANNIDIMAGYHTIIAKPRHNESTRFLAYFFDSPCFRSQIRSQVYGVKVFSITKSILKNTKVLLPPLPEQEAIAAYLDEKTTHIDSAIANLQLQAEKLSAYKRQLIAKTVTRGLNETVTYKDSGIEWIGKIPAGWEVRRFRTLFLFSHGVHITKTDFTEQGILCATYGDVHAKGNTELNPDTQSLHYIDIKFTETSKNAKLRKNDFVFADTSEDIEGSGNFTYLANNIDIMAGYHTIIAKPRHNESTRFLAYFFDSPCFRSQIRSQVYGVKVFSITKSILKNTKVLLPPLPEQESIAAYLDKKITLIDSITADIQRQIEQLKNYRKIIIHDAVTGRIKVPENAQ